MWLFAIKLFKIEMYEKMVIKILTLHWDILHERIREIQLHWFLLFMLLPIAQTRLKIVA